MVFSVLIVEDDLGVQQYLSELLMDNGYSVFTANDGIEALEVIEKRQPEVVILDLNLPRLTGEGVVQEIRKRYPKLQVIILSAKDTLLDVIHGLHLGADDYMTKPFVGEELLARVRARLNNIAPREKKLKVHDLELDPDTASVTRKGEALHLTPQEFKLLE